MEKSSYWGFGGFTFLLSGENSRLRVSSDMWIMDGVYSLADKIKYGSSFGISGYYPILGSPLYTAGKEDHRYVFVVSIINS